jgi:uncharacterized protein with FMN-binding domain
MEKISRQNFLKIASAAVLSSLTAGALSACGSSGTAASEAASGSEAAVSTKFTPGTYSASAPGIGGDVTVTMTFDESSITDVVIDASSETPSLGGAAAEQLKEALLSAQSAEIDAISGSTVTSDAIKQAAADCINQANGTAFVLSGATAENAGTDTAFAERPDKGAGFPSDHGAAREDAQPIPPVDVPASWDAEYDVVVVGSGIGGPKRPPPRAAPPPTPRSTRSMRAVRRRRPKRAGIGPPRRPAAPR